MGYGIKINKILTIIITIINKYNMKIIYKIIIMKITKQNKKIDMIN